MTADVVFGCVRAVVVELEAVGVSCFHIESGGTLRQGAGFGAAGVIIMLRFCSAKNFVLVQRNVDQHLRIVVSATKPLSTTKHGFFLIPELWTSSGGLHDLNGRTESCLCAHACMRVHVRVEALIL